MYFHTPLRPQDGPFLHYTGMETDLIFNHGVDLPGFAAFPLLESTSGREILRSYANKLLALGRQTGAGVMLDTATWRANRDRGAALGYSPERLLELNRDSVELRTSKSAADVNSIVSAQVGPRGDGYTVTEKMTASEARAYHEEQIAALGGAGAALISGFTLNYADEAIGIVGAAEEQGLPVAIAFTVETDGNLPDGSLLRDAIDKVDAATSGFASYYLINCAHPDHFAQILRGESWELRLRGVVANASRCSHAELDEAEELDDGDPGELASLMVRLKKINPHFDVFGGCCGTDMRHLHKIALLLTSPA